MNPARLRVCLVVPGFSSLQDDGCIPALRDFALTLGTRHDVTVIPLRFPHTVAPYALGPLQVRPLGGGSARGFDRLALLQRGVQAVLRAGPFDVVQGLWADEPGLIATLAGRRLGTRTVVSFMGGELAALPAVPYGGRLERLGPHLVNAAAHLADHLTVGSPWLLRRLPKPWQHKTSVVPLPIPAALVDLPQRQLPTHSGPLRVGQIASLLPVKAPGLLLAAAALARRRGADLTVTLIGAGPLRHRLGEQAARLDLPVLFTGELSPAAIPAQLATLDVVVQTSWWESQGMAMLEAGAAGCALIGTAVGALADLPTTLAHTPPGRVAPLAAALAAAAADRERTHAAGVATSASVRGHYDPHTSLARWQQLLGAADRRPAAGRGSYRSARLCSTVAE